MTLAQYVAAKEAASNLMSLQCGHTFTLDHLDHQVGLQQVYEKQEGNWTGLRSPTSGVVMPRCPTCSRSISSPRYGRVAKRAIIELEARHALHAFRASTETHSAALPSEEQIRSLVEPLPPWRDTAMPNLASVNTALRRRAKGSRMVDVKVFTEIAATFSINGPILPIWTSLAKDTIAGLRGLVNGINRNTALIDASNAAFERLCDDRIIDIQAVKGLSDEERHDHAAGHARTKMCGKPISLEVPRLEAVLQTVKLRFRLVYLARTFAEVLRTAEYVVGGTRSETKVNGEVNSTMSRRFGILAWTLLRSCAIDLDYTIKRLSTGSPSKTLGGDGMLECWIRVKLGAARCVVQLEITYEEQSSRVRELGKKELGILGQASLVLGTERGAAMVRWVKVVSPVKGEKAIKEEVEKLDVKVQGMFDLWGQMRVDFGRGDISRKLDLGGVLEMF